MVTVPTHVEKPHKTIVPPLPPPGLPVQIQCSSSKCIAFREKDGKWVNFFTRESITDFRGVIPQ
jgi:hypothetical protein